MVEITVLTLALLLYPQKTAGGERSSRDFRLYDLYARRKKLSSSLVCLAS